MEKRKFGTSGIEVSVLGFGGGHIGGTDMEETEVEKLISASIEAGITLFDTARSYGASEERLGNCLKSKRNKIVISTKVGYSIPGYEDWTYQCIIAGVDAALKLLQTDYLDIVHFHSCPLSTLQRGEVTEALLKTKADGKIRCAAYSGENDELQFAINSGAFGSVQTSMNIFDQRSLKGYIPDAIRRGMGVIAKRPLGNCPWKFTERPFGQYPEDYWVRMKTMELEFGELWSEIALRFAAFHSGAHSLIIGTNKIGHLLNNARMLENGPLPEDIVNLILNAFNRHDNNWEGLI